MTQRILFVDDEPLLLENYQGLLETDFQVETTDRPQEALRRVRDDGPYAVIVSDLRMPGMDGIELLSRVRALSPDTVRVMVTGCGELAAAAKAVNEGNVFRFLTKPAEYDDLKRAVQAALDQHRLIRAEHELLENTLAGSIKMLIEILSLINPGAFGRSSRIRRNVRHMAQKLGLKPIWQFELAGMLSQIGYVAVSPEILDKKWAGQNLTPEEEELISGHASVGSALLANIPRLEKISRMIALQSPADRKETGQPRPERRGIGYHPADRRVPLDPPPPIPAPDDDTTVLGGQLLRTALAMDQQVVQGISQKKALEYLLRHPELYPREMVQALSDAESEPTASIKRAVKVRELDTFMILDEDVYAGNGLLLATKGLEVTVPVLLRLRSFASSLGVKEPLRVLIPGETWTRRAA